MNPGAGWPRRVRLFDPAPSTEAVILVALGAYVGVTQRTLTSILDRMREHPVGFLALTGLAGSGLGHILLDDRRRRP